MNMNSMLLADFYKVGHVFQYPPKTEYVFSNFTPRKSRMEGVDGMVLFGLQFFCKEYLIKHFNENFFNRPKAEVLASYKRRIGNAIGGLPSYKHIEDLHDLGYLPVRIKALKEGTVVPMRVAAFTIINTKPEFYWVTNFLETLMSCAIWQACTSATIAHEYRKVVDEYFDKSGMDMAGAQFALHDFGYRGLSSPESAVLSGMGHLLSSVGTDTIPAIDGLEQYYNANSDKELVGCSIAATEHSTACCNILTNDLTEGIVPQDDQLEISEYLNIKRLITEIYPSGFVSYVSDSFDLWAVCSSILPKLKNEIMSREGRLVIRPDSGHPVKIICGDPDASDERARKGVVELLWETFGGTMTSKGYKLLDSHIGAIYGDSITRKFQKEIFQGLMDKGFAPQCVLGIGSYTYQYNTRDTFGTAIKATWCVIDGKPNNIFKRPKTDDGTKNSACGLLMVYRENGKLVMKDNCSFEEEASEGNLLEIVFEDGKLIRDQSLAEIREILTQERAK